MTISADQLRALQIVERTASSLSVVGIATIIITFFSSRYFRNPIDRLILINAFYNAFDVTATMISLSGPAAGNGSALCQFQGFLMQMFPLADVLWTLAMAIDVFLIVYYQYDANALRRLEIKYIGAITAITFTPAFVFLFIHTAEKGHLYGSVTLWCAIAPKWVMFRIIFYYAPIWIIIGIVFILYCMVGWKIVKGKRALRSIESDIIPLDLQQTVEKDDDDNTTESTQNTKSTEGAEGTARNAIGLAVSSSTRTLGPHTSMHGGMAASAPTTKGHTVKAWSRDGTESISPLRPVDDFGSSPDQSGSASFSMSPSLSSHKWQANRSALSLRQYLLMPVMFFVVLMAIWVAPTTNRLLSFVEPSFVSFPLYIAVGATGSLRGFWNGCVFLAVGLRSRQSQRRLEAVRPGHYR
ncbi:cAMP receptor (Car4) [Sporothrix brasiliensis 5110]|uniref:cAMP receptor (Car4) n=1 Tax=Sporothrix brasiliensis 5110 TaxID=1398154 RepID=A0A0C2J5P6_9PEZI|nr:cAMP receptor (Car4) [Sporothrix brasiliensis 5110]KIH94315.1 cAMP receptor (Car4) [Sporothrix brasiliensis 5110]